MISINSSIDNDSTIKFSLKNWIDKWFYMYDIFDRETLTASDDYNERFYLRYFETPRNLYPIICKKLQSGIQISDLSIETFKS